MTDSRPKAPSSVATVEEIRAHFPALARRHRGGTVGYFDAPGGTQVPASVADAVTEQMLHHNANAHWAYDTSRELDRVLSDSRAALADFVGGQAEEIVFGANMTSLTFHLARALGRTFEPADEIVVTDLDHMANVSPWRDLEIERGVSVRAVPLDLETGGLDWAALEASLTPHTRVVAVTAASNALGTIVDLPRVQELAGSIGALLFVDAVHLAPHERINVETIGCDFLVCSPYKFYGPHLGVLWGRRRLLEDVLPPKLAPAPDAAPEKWETGTLNHEGIAGAGAAVNFLASLARGGERPDRLDAVFAELSARGDDLIRRLWHGLEAIGGVRLYGPRPGSPRTPTLSFTIEGLTPFEAATRLSDEWGLYLSHGDFYASSVTASFGLEPDGLIRAGCACYTNAAEVDRLVEAVEALAGA